MTAIDKTKKFEILINDVGTDRYIDTYSKKDALIQAKDNVINGQIFNHFQQNTGIITVDEITPEKTFIGWLRQENKNYIAIIEERSTKIFKLQQEISEKIVALGKLARELEVKEDTVAKMSITLNEYRNREIENDNQRRKLQDDLLEAEEENQRYYEVEKAVKTIKEFLGGI